MKLATLLAEFLYTTKRLDLPGIGSFLVGGSGDHDGEANRSAKTEMGDGVYFENNTRVKEVPTLVDFIARTSGKIRALAAADLDSHLENAKQFLNIGKPFLFEGIGTLTKQQGGGFNFVAGAMLPEKVKEQTPKETVEGSETEEPVSGFKNIFYSKKSKGTPKKTLAIFLMLGGLAFAIWGGYTIYKKTISRKNNNPVEEIQSPAAPVTTQPVTVNDSTGPSTQATLPPGNYKFIVETTDKFRALKRYSLLKGYGIGINIETNDSTDFRLFFILPATPADTTRLLDSLKRLYTPPGGGAYIEK
ncbi:MAG TPA: hypothetical protein VMZ03_06055 [Chitinophagaceae bacterium]|nr:hypothetical protein [Chitinophagaceae bacterium]